MRIVLTTQSPSDHLYKPSKERASKAQVKVLEPLAGFWSLYMGIVLDYSLQTQTLEDPIPLGYVWTNTCQVLLGFREATVPG